MPRERHLNSDGLARQDGHRVAPTFVHDPRVCLVSAIVLATGAIASNLRSHVDAASQTARGINVSGRQPAVVAACATFDVDERTAASTTVRAHRQSSAVDIPMRIIPIAFHVVHRAEEGNISDARIGEQIGSLNCAFSGTGFSFRLASIDRTDETWYRGCFGHETGSSARWPSIPPAH